MTRNHTSQRINNRGSHYHISLRGKEYLEESVDRLVASLGINPQPEPLSEKPAQDDDFGIAELLAAFGIFCMAGLLNLNL